MLDSLERRGIDAADLNQRLGLPVDADALDVYTRHGISELDDLRVLQVPPLSELGSPGGAGQPIRVCCEVASSSGSPQ